MVEPVNKKRYERKFIAEGMDLYNIHTIIRYHPAGFRPIYHPRYINNIYFDTPGYNFYYDNHHGTSERKKVRIRWYSNQLKDVKNPYLEFKQKNGLVGSKKVYPLSSFSLNKNIDIRMIMRQIEKDKLPEEIRNQLSRLEPKITNRYRRQYFLSADKKFRLTVDSSVSYYAVTGRRSVLRPCYNYNRTIILELKYDVEDDLTAGEITRHLPFRIDKNSKYVNGIDCFNYMGAV